MVGFVSASKKLKTKNIKLKQIILKYKQLQTTYSILLLVLFFGVCFSANGQREKVNTEGLKLARVFGNNMVLQQNEAITIWGEAAPRTKILAQLGDEKREVITDETGKWLLTFSPRKASFKPISLKVNSLCFEDILIGEVWLCSGQSNMQFGLKNIDTYHSIQASTLNHNLRILRHSNIRIVAKNGYSEDELGRCNTKDFFEANWEISTEESAAKTSALAWLLGQGIQQELDVPVGIIQVAVGGSALNNWIPPAALKSNPLTNNFFETNWLKNEQIKLAHRTRAQDAFQNILKPDKPYIAGKMPYRWLCEPGFLFEAGIAPLQHLCFKGVLWYQGESDTDNLEMVKNANNLFPLMIKEWRSFFKKGDFPFIAVQLPAYEGEFWPEFREVQRQTLEELEQTYMVVSIDLGAETNIHPKDKQALGERAVRLALKNVYGFKQLIGFPSVEDWEVKGQKISLHFTEFGTGMNSVSDTISGFEIAGKNGEFVQATAFLSSENTIKVLSPVKRPLQLRYAWMPFPKPPLSIYNSEHLPLQPFVIHLN